MGTDLKVRERQKDHLFVLLELEALNKGKEITGLKRAISQAKNGMNEEDILDVIQNILELYSI